MKYRLSPQALILPTIAGIIAWFISKDLSVGFATLALFLMPSLIQIYVPYARNNPKHLWFKRKLYGWGWTPVTWQGWLVTLIYIVSIALFSMTIDSTSSSSETAFTFGIPVTLLTVTFFRILYKKGEKPRWQWGSDEDE